MSLTWEKMQEMADDAHVGMCIHGRNALTGEPVDRLPAHLWEPLRLRLQSIYREATGEEFSVLTVDGDAEITRLRSIISELTDTRVAGPPTANDDLIAEIHRLAASVGMKFVPFSKHPKTLPPILIGEQE